MNILNAFTHTLSSLTSSGTFSQSPLVAAAAASSFFGFVLSFLLNENERNDKNRFFDFSFFAFLALSVAGVDEASASPASAPSLLSSKVPVVVSAAFSVPSPFSVGFSSAFASAAAGSAAAAASSAFSATAGAAAGCSLFSVTASFSFSASSFFSSFVSFVCKKNKFPWHTEINEIQSIEF